MNNSDMNLGTITVSLRAAAQAAEYITKNHDGVASLAPKRGLKRALRGDSHRGVHFTNTPSGLEAELYIYTVYGVNVNKICADISEKIRCELENNMGIPINKVKVFVEGVHG